MHPKGFRRLVQRIANGGHLAQGIQETVVVNETLIPDCGDIDACLVKLAGVGFAFVAQDVVARGLDERRRQPPLSSSSEACKGDA